MSVKSRALRMAVRGRRIGRSPATKALAAVAAQLGLVGGVSYGTGRFFGRRRAMHGKGDPESGGQIALGAITNPLVALGRRHGYNKAKYGVTLTSNVPKFKARTRRDRGR